MENQIELLEKDGLLQEYIEEFAEMTLGCTEVDTEEFYARMSEDLVEKGAYLTQEEDSELIRLLAKRSDDIVTDIIVENRRNLFEKFRQIGVEL